MKLISSILAMKGQLSFCYKQLMDLKEPGRVAELVRKSYRGLGTQRALEGTRIGFSQ